MRKIYLTNILCFCFLGCVAASPSQAPQGASSGARKNLIAVDKVKIGMTVSEVTTILGSELKIGYIQKAQSGEMFEAVTLKQPYRVEAITARGQQYEVYSYYAAIEHADGLISEEELVPIVFAQGRVVGKGRDYLFKLQSAAP